MRRGSGDPPLFLGLQAFGILLLVYGFYWAVLVPSVPQVPPEKLWPWQLASLGLVTLRLKFASFLTQKAQVLKPILNDTPQSRTLTLMAWRWYQLLKRLQISRLCLFLIALCWLLICTLALLRWPNFILILLSLFASMLLSAAIAFLLEEDMRSIWFERQLGCSHEEFVSLYQNLSLVLGLGLGLLMGLPALLLSPLSFLQETWKLIPIAALCPVLLPSVMFQLAPERSLLQILVVSLMGLFLGTAIYAHSLSLLLVPLVISYAKQYQKDNFYRS